MCVLVSLAIAIYGVITEKKRAKRRWQNQISIEFREGLQGIAAALQAGYSMENALEESQKIWYCFTGNIPFWCHRCRGCHMNCS